ncbi:MAG: bifunctional diguanylate cyclase/phosphodiesterase [Gallionellaceae bacterium]|nr:bifunctional diguanylate cyclase/phosphodiesterase [Gallionellaceae bacterium]
MAISFNEVLASNARILNAKASKVSMQAVIVAVVAVVAATLLVSFTESHAITLDGIMNSQRSNFVLWILDALPFIFGYIGQYASYVMSQEASLMVLEQTEELRQYANRMEKQAAFSATHDPLTELPNRALFYDRLEQAIRADYSQRGMLAVLLLSIDNLKEIQDTLGPDNTDLLVKQLATRLASWSDSEDSVAHIDSHNFAILLGGCGDRAVAETAARNLIKAIEPHFIVNAFKLTLHPSIGIVMAPEHGDDADTLLQRAGVAAYSAGKSISGYSVYSPTMDEHSPRRLTLMGELKRALERDELQLYYQPKIDLASNSVIGVEALVRWPHMEHGFIPPEEFIGLAERTRMIRPLSQWVLERAFQTCADWHQAGRALIVSVNLSTKDLHDPELPDQIAGIAAKTGLLPEWIVFEITEGSIMVDPLRVLAIVERLRGMGFQLSIDDFGTGYSSLSYLKKLPVSELKIDKSFVMDMLASESDAVIVRATVDLAHNLGLKVTAEGIENPEALEMLKRFGCDIGQGFLFAQPMPMAELEAWLSAWPLASTGARPAAFFDPALQRSTGLGAARPSA